VKILIGCEHSGIVRDAFRLTGHKSWSCDLLFNNSKYHIVDDVLSVMIRHEWDMLIIHPPCTYLCSSGLHWNGRTPGRKEKTEKALQFVHDIIRLSSHIPKVCIENPVGCIGTRIRKADQYIQPYQFGHNASKRTGLWLKGLPNLKPTEEIPPRVVNGLPRWENQTDSGQNKLGPSADRWKLRSETYSGIALAMADQWG